MTPTSQGVVLIVDDEAANLGILFESLRAADFKVLVAEDGASTLQRVKRITPDVILLDVKLPDIDGFALCQKLRTYPHLTDIPIMFLSALTDISTKLQGLGSQAVDYITKPFHPEEVVARIEKQLTIQHLQQQLKRQNERLQQEITCHQHTEQALRESEARYRAIISAIPDTLLRINRDGQYLDCHGILENTLIAPPEEIIGKNIRDLGFPEAFIEQALEAVGQSLETNTHLIFEYEMEIDQQFQSHEARIIPLSEEEVLILIRNITQRKKIERALKEAKLEAESANRSKSMFLANMSHELRTPLNIIMGNCQIISKEPGNTQEVSEGLRVIFQSGQHLLTLINDLLDLARIGTKQIELMSYELDFTRFLKNLTTVMQIQAHEKELDFLWEFDASLPEIIIADEKRLRQVLLNLLTNAIRFTRRGRVTFRVQLRSKDFDNEEYAPDTLRARLRFEVEDTGIGIPPEQLNRIFLPFEQLRNAEQWHPGTGAGLSISHHLVELMGSTLQVKSEPDKGSIFWFEATFPVFSFERTITPDILVPPPVEPEPEIIPPPQEELEELYHFVILGMMDRVDEKIALLHAQDDTYHPFVQAVTRFTKKYADDKLLVFLERYLRNNE